MNFENKIYEIIKKNVSVIYENEEITDNTDLIRDLGFDSITIIQLIIDIEEAFGIEFDDEIDHEDIIVVRNFKNYILTKAGI